MPPLDTDESDALDVKLVANNTAEPLSLYMMTRSEQCQSYHARKCMSSARMSLSQFNAFTPM